jgi:hypothetical protein
MDMNGMKMAAALQGRGNAGQAMQGMPMAQQGGRPQPGIPNRQGMPQQPLQAGPQGMNTQSQMQGMGQQPQQIPPQALAAMQQMRQQGMQQGLGQTGQQLQQLQGKPGMGSGSMPMPRR